MDLFTNATKLKYNTENGENASSPEVVEVVLVQFNFVDNQYQQNPGVLYTFTSNKS